MANQQITTKLDRQDAGRSAAIAALQTIFDLDPAGGQFIDPDHHAALFRLFLALRSLDHGKVHDMLKPSPVENRPHDSIDVKCNKALAAAAMDVLMQRVVGVERKTEVQAAKYVARIVQSKKSNIFKSNVTWKTVRGWRQDLNARADRIDIDDDVNLFHLIRADVQDAGIPPEQIAAAILEMSPW